jgi:asparagine synthase (glutamine-hydrolysing)
MCAISGYIEFNLERIAQREEWLQKAIEMQEHRGQDGNGTWFNENKSVGIGHNRQAIIDLSNKGLQPMVNGDWIISFNGEIYNYKLLQRHLFINDDLADHNPGNDAYTLLAYVSKFGIKKALNDVVGMFAIALYNQKEQKLYIIADHFGQKSAHIAPHSSGIYFATQMAPLLKTRSNWTLNADALDTYWMLGGVIGRQQIVNGIERVTAGTMAIYDLKAKELTYERWYSPKVHLNTRDIKEYIYHAIDEVKVADTPVNIFLSGGIDSTLVASRFKESTAIHLASPEEQYARQVADKYSLNLKVCNPTNYHINDILTDYVTKSGEPTMAGAIPWITSKEARQFGKVAVIANGADELFFGYDRLHNDNLLESKAQNNHMFRGSVFNHTRLNKYRQKHGIIHSSRLTELELFVQYDLNRTIDAASTCHNLEVRSPFLNHHLVEAALHLPEYVHRTWGNKTILKQLLIAEGFTHDFTNRPKIGFSLHYTPEGIEKAKQEAWQFVLNNGFLKVNTMVLSGRDQQYLQSAALGFHYWYKHWMR